MKTQAILNCSDAEILKIAQDLRIAYKLKTTLRYDTERDFSVHSESVAEHVYAMIFLAQYFLPLEDPEKKLDQQKIHQLILFHDFGEIINGDIPYYLKTKADEEQEHKDAQEVFAALPESIREVARSSWQEYESKHSQEAKFIYALDKLEPSFELLDPISQKSLKRTQCTHQAHLSKKLAATEDFPVMRRFVMAISDELLRKDAFWTEAS